MTTITEIAPEIYRISIYNAQINLQFNHFLVKDDEPLLYHTGTHAMFPEVKRAVAELIDLSQLRWISYSHFEADECGTINEWIMAAPDAQAVSTITGARVNLNDFATKRPLALPADSEFQTGKSRFRIYPTPHLPHGWDAEMLFEESTRTLFCSDLLHQYGDVEPVCYEDDTVLQRFRQALEQIQLGQSKDYIPYTSHTDQYLSSLSALEPHILATQHGSTYIGDGGAVLRRLSPIIREAYENS